MKKQLITIQRAVYSVRKEISFAIFSLLLTMKQAYANALWEVSDTAEETIFGYFATVYRKWAWIGFVISFLIYWTSKDDRKSAIYGKICIGIVVVYVLTWLEPVFHATLEDIKNAFLATT